VSVTTEADLTIRQASGFEVVFIYCAVLADSAPPAPDPTRPVNVTGWTARLQIRAAIDGELFAEASSADGSITVGTTNGQFTVKLSADQTSALTRDGVYDLLAQAPTVGAQPERVAQGSVSIERAVTTAI